MRVLYLNHSEQISGAEQSLRALLWQLRRAHPEVETVVALPDGGPLWRLLRDEEWNVVRAPLRRLKRPRGAIEGVGVALQAVRAAVVVARLVKAARAQIVHSNSTTAHLAGGLAAARAGRPALWHARDLVSLQRVGPLLAVRAARVVAISEAVAQRLQQDGVPAAKVRVIHNGLDPDEWTPRDTSQSRLRQSLGLPSETFLWGCAAQLAPWKNHRAFIDAAALLCRDEGCSHLRFALIGGDLWSARSGYARQLRDRVKAHGLGERFHFVPQQRDNIDALAALDALVLPSRAEPFGRVLIEGMALQKPVVAWGAAGPLEIVTHERDGLLVPPSDNEMEKEADALAHAMKRLTSDAALRRHLGTQARQTVVERFHIADSAARTLDLYREVLA